MACGINVGSESFRAGSWYFTRRSDAAAKKPTNMKKTKIDFKNRSEETSDYVLHKVH